MEMENFTLFKPHLIRAYYQWFTENGLRVCVLLKLKNLPQVEIFDNQKPTVLVDISSQATRDLKITSEVITGKMSMNGQVINFVFPMDNVLGIYAENTGLGELFIDEMGSVDVEHEVSQQQGNCCRRKLEKDKKVKIIR